MKRILITTSALLVCTTASAFADPVHGWYAGAQIGYHDIGDITLDTGSSSVDGFIYGGYIGANFRVGETFFIGTEGNFNFGTGEIDSDYGVVAQAGFAPTDQYAVFLRAGYQWVDFDVEDLAEDIFPGLTEEEVEAIGDSVGDDTDDGFLIGVGGQYALSESISLRAIIDTIEFDTYRITSGVTFHF